MAKRQKQRAIALDQKTWRKTISQRMYVDIVKTSGARSIKEDGSRPWTPTLRGDFDWISRKVAQEVAEKSIAHLTANAKKDYISALDELTEIFKNGLPHKPNTYRMKDFSTQYASRKRTADKKRTGRAVKTADKFWTKERGGVNRTTPWLANGFSRFTKSYKQTIRNTKGVVALHGSKPVYRGTRHRVSMDINMPRPKVGGDYLTKLLHDAYYKRQVYEDFTRQGASDSLPGELKKLAWLETGPPNNNAKARPFISRLMSKRGQSAREDLDKVLQLALNTNLLGGLQFRL